MEPYKVKDKKEWSSIDIFLFSNGQQYSPPRKYHLRSEELQWWGSTLSYLGRTHFGSGHSTIELYAIDGKKINGPLELTNGAAYVVVEPPDSFINTGYEEYLLRASRSWEKRLSRKSYTTETSDLGDTNNKDPAEQSKDDRLPEKIADTTSLKVEYNATALPQKSRLNKPYQRFQRKSNVSAKPIQKKKYFDPHGGVLNRMCGETDKIYPCPNKTPLKKNGYINQRPFTTIPRKSNETTNQEQSQRCKKRAFQKPETDINSKNSKNGDTHDSSPIKETQIVDLYNNNKTDSMSLINDLEDYPVTDNSVNDAQKILTKDNVPNEVDLKHRNDTGNEQDFEKHSSNKLEQNEYEQNIGKINLDNIDPTKNIEVDREEKIPITNNDKENKFDNVLNSTSDKQVIDEYIAQMNKGGLLFLKLKVRLKDCKTIFNKDKIKNTPTETLLSNLPKTEKTSQVDINISFSGELLKPNDQQYVHDRSLQSLLDKLYTEDVDYMNTKNPRTIILQCACRDYSDDHKCICEDKKYETMLDQNLNEQFTRYEYQKEPYKITKNENTMTNGTISQSEKEANEDKTSQTKINGTRVKDLKQKFERLERVQDKNNTYNHNTSIENQRQSDALSRLNNPSILERGSENEVNKCDESNLKTHSTQTDWSNVLLEAKLHADNNYTFHLPSMDVLKQCNL